MIRPYRITIGNTVRVTFADSPSEAATILAQTMIARGNVSTKNSLDFVGLLNKTREEDKEALQQSVTDLAQTMTVVEISEDEVFEPAYSRKEPRADDRSGRRSGRKARAKEDAT